MKKILSLVLCAALTVSLLAGCSSNLPKGYNPFGQGGETAAAGALKTGLAVVGSASKSVAPADGKNGTAQMDTTVVAVLVDANGVIVDCKIDGVQTKVEYDTTGKILTPLDAKIPTKIELGEGYGMKKASSIGKEWSEQAAALAEYVIGKTVAEVKGIAMDETTKPTGADLASSVTISIGGFIPAIEKAVMNAQELGAQTGDKLGLGVDTNISKSKDAAADKDGQAQAYSMYAATSFDVAGKITSCILDGSQTNVNFNAKGELTSDINAAVLSKNELKEDYGMKGSSGIGKEWYEQAAAYAAYVTGKSLAEVQGVAMDESGHATAADLTASVTVSIGAFNTCLERAALSAGATSAPAATGALKTGLAILGDAAKSKAPADGKNGTAQMDTTVVAVLVDANGVIVDCKIDGVQTKVEYDATGKILTPLDTKIPTKIELGESYGMKKASSIGKEWSEQAAALAEYVIGKTVAEVKGIAMDETTKPTDPTLAASVTVSIGGYVAAIEKAVANAQSLGAQTGDKLGLGVDTNISKSKDAAADKDGQAQAYSMYTASSFNSDGKITSCILDGSQTNVTFNAKGELTSDINAAVRSKNELKEDYGMKGSSGIGLEWYQQAANYAAYVTGKTLAEVQGVAMDESGHATGADLASSVTVSIGAFNTCLARAAMNAGQASGAAAGALKTGLAILGDAGKSKAPADGKNGTAQMDTTVVAVLVDANGVIVDCKIDGVQTKVEYDANGKILTPLDAKIPTKTELGTGYGMGKVSSIGKEWSEQAAALAEYVIGKTVAEVKGIAMDETTKPTDPTLAASVTVSIGGYVAAIEKAVANAQSLGAQTGDKLGLGVDTNISKSKDAAADKDGQAQAYSMYAATSFDAAGKITSCILDGSQTNVTFNAKGELTSDIKAAVRSKNELKEDYGMKGSSGIGKEWYEQAAAYAAYVTGKTPAEVQGVAMDETGHATGADLTASVTVSIGAFNACVERAAQNA